VAGWKSFAVESPSRSRPDHVWAGSPTGFGELAVLQSSWSQFLAAPLVGGTGDMARALVQHHGVLSTIWGPLVAILSFVCSIGNVPLALYFGTGVSASAACSHSSSPT
jgi:hypothetical protein